VEIVIMTVDQAMEVLGISAPLSETALKQAYRDLVQVWHPDRFQDARLKAKATEKLKALNGAYEFLVTELDRARIRPPAEATTGSATRPAQTPSASPEMQAPARERRSQWQVTLAFTSVVISLAMLLSGAITEWFFCALILGAFYAWLQPTQRETFARVVVLLMSLSAVIVAVVIVKEETRKNPDTSRPNEAVDANARLGRGAPPTPTSKAVYLWNWLKNQPELVEESRVGDALLSNDYNPRTGNFGPSYGMPKGTGLLVRATDGRTYLAEADKAQSLLQNGYTYAGFVSADDMSARAAAAQKACDDWKKKPERNRKEETASCVKQVRLDASANPGRLFQLVNAHSKEASNVLGSMVGDFLRTGYAPLCGNYAHCPLR
jgi:hypothetical protein